MKLRHVATRRLHTCISKYSCVSTPAKRNTLAQLHVVFAHRSLRTRTFDNARP